MLEIVYPTPGLRFGLILAVWEQYSQDKAETLQYQLLGQNVDSKDKRLGKYRNQQPSLVNEVRSPLAVFVPIFNRMISDAAISIHNKRLSNCTCRTSLKTTSTATAVFCMRAIAS